MSKYTISVNPMAEFGRATELGKIRIVRQQITPNKIKISYYQLPRARFKKSIVKKGDLGPVLDGIEILMARKSSSSRQEKDRIVSIEALERFVAMKLPLFLEKIDYDVITPTKKSTNVLGVDVVVSPDIIIKGRLGDKIVVGAIKIHISKTKPFGLQEAQIVSSMIYKYLDKEIALEGEIVLPELCFCLDIFGGRIISAKDSPPQVFKDIERICYDIKTIWDAA